MSAAVCAHGQVESIDEHTCPDALERDCFYCVCCGNCREDVDDDDLCLDCGGRATENDAVIA